MVPYQTFNWVDPYEKVGSEDSNDRFCPHIEAVTVVQGNAVTQVNPEGVEQMLAPNGTSLSGRGTCVCLTFFTEDARRFYITYQFHKGQVFRKVSEEEPCGTSDLPELWRD